MAENFKTPLPPKNFKKILWGKGENNEEPIPKIIWAFWDGPKPPPLVELCLSHTKKIMPDYDFRILNKASVKKYLPDCIALREDISFISYTDLLRLNLIKDYGGFWMDASMLFTENFDWLVNLKKQFSTDVVGFYADTFTPDENYPVLETWFFGAPPKNKFITSWYEEFVKCYTSPDPHQYFNDIKTSENHIKNVDEWLANYLIAYLAAIKVMRKSDDYRILMLKASETAHFYNFGSTLNKTEFCDVFLKNPKPEFFPKIIKFERKGRNFLDERLKIGKFRKNSFLFSVLRVQNYNTLKIKSIFPYLKFIKENLFKKYLR